MIDHLYILLQCDVHKTARLSIAVQFAAEKKNAVLLCGWELFLSSARCPRRVQIWCRVAVSHYELLHRSKTNYLCASHNTQGVPVVKQSCHPLPCRLNYYSCCRTKKCITLELRGEPYSTLSCPYEANSIGIHVKIISTTQVEVGTGL